MIRIPAYPVEADDVIVFANNTRLDRDDAGNLRATTTTPGGRVTVKVFPNTAKYPTYSDSKAPVG